MTPDPDADGQASPRPETCSTTACRVEAAVRAWPSGPGRRDAAIRALQGPEERLAVARILLDRATHAEPAICQELLEDPGSRQWCAASMHRPHLYEKPRPAARTRAREAAGPVDTQLLPTGEPADFVRGMTVDMPACGPTEAPRACATNEATRLGRLGQLRDAGAVCQNLDEGRWRDECVFVAAEAAMATGDPRRAGLATRLCAHAGTFQAHCTSHIVTKLAMAAPAASSGQGADWADAIAAADSIQAAWQGVDDAYGQIITARFWAELLAWAYRGAPEVTGDPLDHLPSAAHPHVRAAATHRWLQLQPPQRTLDDHITAAREVLAKRATQAHPLPTERYAPKVRNLWALDDPRTTSLPATFWRGGARRVISDDPEMDLIICVLEALAQASPPQPTAIAEAMAHPNPLVRATAERLAPAVRQHNKGPAPRR